MDNFIRCESDLYFGNIVKDGGFGKFLHRREPAAIDNQTVIRLNRVVGPMRPLAGAGNQLDSFDLPGEPV